MKILMIFLLIPMLVNPALGLEITPPPLTGEAARLMPENTQSFGEGLWELLQESIFTIRPDLKAAVALSASLVATVLIVAMAEALDGKTKRAASLAGVTTAAALLLGSANTMHSLASRTIQDLSGYGRLLLPVMTAALAAQGGVSASAGLYAGTAAFDALLTALISEILLPGVYLYLALVTAHGALGEETLKRFRDMTKSFVSWCLKILLTVYTTYMSITGVVSGTTDAATLKAARVTISTFVPVVGGILSDASESVLVSAGVMKSAAGVYGILAMLAIFLEPFLRIGLHYLMLKATACITALFGTKQMNELIEGFAGALGLLLGMTGAVCLMLLISTVCFMKGVS